MGLGMATNLQKHVSQLPGASPLQYHNRTMSRGDPLRELRASPAESVAALVASSDIIFLSLSNDEALSVTIDAILAAGGSLEEKLVVDTSTVHPDSSVAARDRLAARGVVFLATPVFGASPVAADGKLLWILAGPEPAVQVIAPYLVGVMARQVIRLGEDVKQASLLKTAG
jgi:3-hydroxyisobutyrate dehydrogenase-like beta-hydroxyacid dehydrogenase